jgi:hypothetical protein
MKLSSGNRYRSSDGGMSMGTIDGVSAPFSSPLHIPDEEAMEMAEGLPLPPTQQQAQSMFGLSLMTNGGGDDRNDGHHTDHSQHQQQQPQITGFAMQIQELE